MNTIIRASPASSFFRHTHLVFGHPLKLRRSFDFPLKPQKGVTSKKDTPIAFISNGPKVNPEAMNTALGDKPMARPVREFLVPGGLFI